MKWKAGVDQAFEGVIHFQSYEEGPKIPGVRLVELTRHVALEGSFMEILRLDQGSVEGDVEGFEVAQLSITTATPGRINAFHVHPVEPQGEVWLVLTGTLKVVLVDLRFDGAEEPVLQELVLCAEQPRLLFIPPGVAHGYKAGPEGMSMMYAADRNFDASLPNEGRIPWDHFGAGIWQEDRG